MGLGASATHPRLYTSHTPRYNQPNEAIGVEAARLRQRHPISVPDAYCLATAKHTSSAVSSFDQKILKAATREGIEAA